MRLYKISRLFVAFIGFVISLAVVSPARGDQVLGFVPNGLSGWSTYGDAGTVTENGGLATIMESTNASETDLYMNFTVPTGGAQSLIFTINAVNPDSPYTGGSPDSFGASLGVITPDMSGMNPPTVSPLVPTVPFSDSFYTMDVVTDPNATSILTAAGASAPTFPTILGQVSVDLSGLAGGESAGILFRLIGGSDPYSSSTVIISNVEIMTGSAVPEPSSIIPGLSAVLVGAGVMGARRRRKGAGKTERITS
jgi:hypothetical protein